jgi:hypothetical protein
MQADVARFFRMLRNARLIFLWAARKLALRIINSGIPSWAAAAFSPVDRRRSLIVRGMLLQLRRRNDHHSVFWSEAALAYPDDASILRMKIHSALRSGDAAAADADLARLLELREAGLEDARFVIGLTNIDWHNGQTARIRSRVRRFLTKIPRSPEYRVAAVRLSRVVFTHFARRKRCGDAVRAQFARMVDRSDLCREPNRLLHRVTACEMRLQKSYPGSLLDTDISSTQAHAFIAVVRDRLRQQSPFSFVRLGDGEAACLPYEPRLAPFATIDARERERIWWGAPLETGERQRIYPRLARAIFDADCVGIPTVARFLRELRLLRNDTLETSLTGRGLRSVLHCMENWDRLRSSSAPLPFFSSCHLHQELELWNCYGELFDGIRDVVLVSCHPALGDWIGQHFGVKTAGHILLPPDRVTGPFLRAQSDRRRLPAILDDSLERLGDLPRNRLVLVGAGLLGKLLVTEARARGGVALDLGSIFDHWLGLKTRSYLDLNAA